MSTTTSTTSGLSGRYLDYFFRFILILGFAVVLPVGLYHRLKAHLASREKLNRRQEGQDLCKGAIQ